MSTSQIQDNKGLREKYIDLLNLIEFIKEKKYIVVKIISIFFFIGLFISLGSINMYKSQALLLPEISDNEGGVSNLIRKFGTLGSLAGIDLGNVKQTEALNPTLYPDIIESTPFIIQLLNSSVKLSSPDTIVTLLKYMNEYRNRSLIEILFKYTLHLPSTIGEYFSENSQPSTIIQADDSVIRLDRNVNKNLKELKKCLNADVNIKTGIITISAEFPDPEIAAQVAEKSVSLLRNYVIKYHSEKAQNNLQFVTIQCEKAKLDFDKIQFERATFIDENKNITSAKSVSVADRLQAQYDLMFNIYNALLQKKEQAKIQVQEETPVCKILNPVEVPLEKSRPKRSLIVVSFIFLGFSASIIFLLIKYISKMQIPN